MRSENPSLIGHLPRSLLGAIALLSVATTAGWAASPNILFLFADDQCHETIRSLGGVGVETPNLDRLVRRGTAFTHAYNMGSWSPAVCVASRTMLVTGRSVWRANAVYNATDKEREAGRLWPQLMSNVGYATYLTGKWHIKADATKVFDVAKHIRAGMPKDAKEGYDRPLAGQPDPWSPYDPEFGGYWEGGRHWSEVVGDDTVEFLGEAKGGGKPFFMYIAFNAPHDPRQSPKEYVDRYPPERVAVPENFMPEYPHKDAMGCGASLRDERLGPFPRTAHAVKVHRGEYYAIISHMDAQIGRILDALEAGGQSANTWIFFTADHGLAVGHHGLFGKQNMYDHSLRVPLIVAGPGVTQGARTDAPVYLQDIMATALEIAGVPKPAHVDFRSLLPLLRGTAGAERRESIYAAYLDLQRAVILDGWKLILYPKAGVARLYNVARDPMEMRDLAGDPAHAETARKLFRRLVAMQGEMGDTLDVAQAFPAYR